LDVRLAAEGSELGDEDNSFLETGDRVSYATLNRVNQLIFVMVKCGVLFEVRTEFLNNI
jgi:hypothetical protein